MRPWSPSVVVARSSGGASGSSSRSRTSAWSAGRLALSARTHGSGYAGPRAGSIAATLQDGRRRLVLAVEGIGGDDAAVQRQQGKQLRQHRDLVRSVGDPQLAEHQALLARPGADQVQRRPAGLAVERAARGLAIDRHHPLHPLKEGRQIAGEATLEGHRIEQSEDPREGVVARDPARELEEPAQQRLLAPPEQRHACPRAGIAGPGGRRRSRRRTRWRAARSSRSRPARGAGHCPCAGPQARQNTPETAPYRPPLQPGRQDQKHLSTQKESTNS